MPIINEKYHVITRGKQEDPAILLLHGIGADHLMWHLQMDVFAHAGYFVIVPDLLGHGKTMNVSKLTLQDTTIIKNVHFFDGGETGEGQAPCPSLESWGGCLAAV